MKAFAIENCCDVCHIRGEGIGVCIKGVEQGDGTHYSHWDLMHRIALVDSMFYHKRQGVIGLPFPEAAAAAEDISSIC